MGTARGASAAGISVGRRLPSVTLPDSLTGVETSMPTPGRAQLVMFASTTCDECRDIYPDLVAIAELDRVLVSHYIFGLDDNDVAEFSRTVGLAGPVVLASQEVGHLYDVQGVPFAFAIDARGVVVAKSLVNTRDQIRELVVSITGSRPLALESSER